jgi:hypothetical protein
MTLLALLAGGRSSSYYRYVDMSDSYYQPRWTFVPTRYFTDDRVYSHAYSWRDNDRYYRGSNNVTNYIQVNNYYVNRSIDPRRWESRTGRQLVTVNVRDANSRDQWRDRDRRDERNISVFHPRIERDRDGRSAPPPAVRATANDKPVVQVQREWTAPEERRDRPNTRDEWRQRYSQGNDRNDNDRDRDRNGRPDTAKPGAATPATPATRATPADPGVNPATRATPATPATPPDRNARQPDRERNDRAQQQREQQERAQQERAQKQREQQEKIQQQRAEQQKAAQERAQQQKVQQQKAQQERVQQQKAAQERAQQQKVQQQKAAQEKAQQQRQQQQQKVQEQQRQQQERAQRTRQPEQAAQPERQQPQRKQEPRGNGNECPPNQPNCR